MKKVLFITIISFIFVSIIVAPVLADKASPKLHLAFTNTSDNKPVDDVTNLMLNNFVVASQELLDKASPIMIELMDKSSLQLYRLDKSTPQLMKEYNKTSPILMEYGKGCINLAKNIEGGSYTADIAGVDSTSAGQITISSDSSLTVITRTRNLGENMDQTIIITYYKSNSRIEIYDPCRGAWCVAGG